MDAYNTIAENNNNFLDFFIVCYKLDVLEKICFFVKFTIIYFSPAQHIAHIFSGITRKTFYTIFRLLAHNFIQKISRRSAAEIRGDTLGFSL